MTALVTLHGLVADEGTVVLFRGVHNELERPVLVVVAVDCRMAQPIADALSQGLPAGRCSRGLADLGPWA